MRNAIKPERSKQASSRTGRRCLFHRWSKPYGFVPDNLQQTCSKCGKHREFTGGVR